MKQYKELVNQVISNGQHRKDRTSVGTLSIFGYTTRYNLQEGFPLLTTKKVNFSAVVKELLWFISGSTNTKDLGCGIWDEWADENGDLGPIYGKQWRDFGGVDQLKNVIEGIKKDPYSRRHIVTAWNPAEIDQMALPPCHVFFQFYVTSDGELDCLMYQRSADIALGVPFNIASYSLLTMMVAQECALKPGVFVHMIGDAHVYKDHVSNLRVQLDRETRMLPTVEIADKPFFDLKVEDFKLIGYNPHPAIKFEVAV